MSSEFPRRTRYDSAELRDKAHELARWVEPNHRLTRVHWGIEVSHTGTRLFVSWYQEDGEKVSQHEARELI